MWILSANFWSILAKSKKMNDGQSDGGGGKREKRRRRKRRDRIDERDSKREEEMQQTIAKLTESLSKSKKETKDIEAKLQGKK